MGEQRSSRNWRRASFACALALAGCGPTITLGDGDGTGDSGTTQSTSGPAVTSAMVTTAMGTTTLDPGTVSVATTIDPSGVDSSDEDAGIVVINDSGHGPLRCSLSDRTACLSGEKCAPWASDGGEVHDSARCVPLFARAGQAGEPCTVEGSRTSGFDDCDVGLVCFEVDPATNEGICRELCGPLAGGGICNDPNTACVEWYAGALPVCSPVCDALLQDCGPGMGCYGEPYIECDFAVCGNQTGTSEQAEPCAWVNDCAPGWQCVDGLEVPECAEAQCCTQICSLDELGSCDAVPGSSCTPQGEEGGCPPILLNSGVCSVD